MEFLIGFIAFLVLILICYVIGSILTRYVDNLDNSIGRIAIGFFCLLMIVVVIRVATILVEICLSISDFIIHFITHTS